MDDKSHSTKPLSETWLKARWKTLSWPTVLLILTTMMLGILFGLGTFTFGYGKGASYFSSDPRGCANCHVMQDYLDTWRKSSHHAVAVCNDCHMPHNFVGKLFTKADNGFFHSVAFTLDNFHEPIQIKPRNRRITQNACIDCHQDFVHDMLPEARGGEALSCIHCHLDAGHALK
jgi:cytochrome c nitrite reductase small subunit